MKLSVKPGRGEKVHIYIDDEYRMTCDGNYWYSEKWHKLKEIDEQELVELENSVNSRRAFLTGMSLLSRRAHSKKELLLKLSQKYPEQAVHRAVERLEELLLIDDEKFAYNYAQELAERKKFAPKRIEAELRAKGIDSQTVRKAINSLDKDDFNRIILLINSKYANKLSDEKNLRKTINSLLRMGYNYSDIKKAISTVKEGIGCDEYYE